MVRFYDRGSPQDKDTCPQDKDTCVGRGLMTCVRLRSLGHVTVSKLQKQLVAFLLKLSAYRYVVWNTRLGLKLDLLI